MCMRMRQGQVVFTAVSAYSINPRDHRGARARAAGAGGHATDDAPTAPQPSRSISPREEPTTTWEATARAGARTLSFSHLVPSLCGRLGCVHGCPSLEVKPALPLARRLPAALPACDASGLGCFRKPYRYKPNKVRCTILLLLYLQSKPRNQNPPRLFLIK